MTNETAIFKAGDRVIFKGEAYTVAAYTRGWYRLTNEDNVAKARAKDITIAVVAGADLEGESAKPSMAQALRSHKKGYIKQHSWAGNNSQSNGDAVANCLYGDDPMEACAKAEHLLGLEPGSLIKRYSQLNAGQVRMNAGNKIRSALKRGDITEDDLV